MGVPQPLSKDQASEKVHDLYDFLTGVFGHMPNIFGIMARNPGALQTLMPFYNTVMNEGAIEAKYKELAYLKASQVNGCEY